MADTAPDQLIALSAQKWEWMSSKDTKNLEALFHDEAIFVHMGATFTKGEELEVIETSRIHYREVEVEDVSARVIGSTGIVLTNLVMHSVVDGNEVTNPFAVTETYVQDGNAWRLGAMAFTRLITK
ncbi:nuclear transport factor 2 family protein [Streptomyces sp. NPDC058045]|uniref:nuclear transport factor 2 family protein n=1 Tax=Streptomyces sp. NPDC058045 TaxID=3346311 RepID=UPI0036ED92B6